MQFSKIFHTILEIFAWCRIVASPLLLGLGISAFVYFPNPSTTRLLLACGISFLGLVLGILWANYQKQKNGSYHFMSIINGSPDLDDFQEKIKKENSESI